MSIIWTLFNHLMVLLSFSQIMLQLLQIKKRILPLSLNLSETAKTAMVLPELKISFLISIGQLCNDNCNIILTKKKLYAVKNYDIILKGAHNLNDGLWDIPIQKRTITSTNYINPPIHHGMYLSSNRQHSSNSVILKSP